MRRLFVGFVLSGALAGCAGGGAVAQLAPAAPSSSPKATVAVAPDAPAPEVADGPSDRSGRPWVGAAGASDAVLVGTTDTYLGVWVDVPAVTSRAHAPVDLALVVDTSGSMAGAKIENARAAARLLIERLADGDIVSIHTFDDQAHERVAPTRLDRSSRARVLSVISELAANGATNLFEGVRLAETRAVAAPPTHPVRRVVLISDGIATVGPTSAEMLGAVAQRGADLGVQITALGVGLDYDEHALDNLAVKSAGRLYHLGEPSEMAGILASELKLLQATMATQAVVEVVPAPGVQILGADGVRLDVRGDGSVELPLGTMFGGQHKEALLRVRVSASGDGTHPLASVRLRFKDPSEGNLERVQEVVARFDVTGDAKAVAMRENGRTQAIMAVQQAAQVAVKAADDVSQGRFELADEQLGRAETKLRESAMHAKNKEQQSRMMTAATDVSSARAAAKRASAAPPAAKPAAMRDGALQLNSAGMKAMGF